MGKCESVKDSDANQWKTVITYATDNPLSSSSMRGWSLKGQEKRIFIYLNCTPSKSRPHEPSLLLSVFNSVQLQQVFLYWSIFWFNWIAQRLFFRFVFIFNFLNVTYFSFLDMLGLVIHHFWWKVYFSMTPGSYRCTNSIELVPRFGLWPSPQLDGFYALSINSKNSFGSFSPRFTRT